MAYCPPKLMENKTYKQDSKITIRETMPGNPPTMGLITAHSLAQG
jgi:hypothetical protein